MTRRILVVEDNKTLRDVLLHVLGSFKVNCYAVDSGEDAVQLAQFFDLILMDVQLPGISGVEATRQIRDIEKAQGLEPVPIIATTSGDNKHECLSAGMNGYTRKPVFRTELSEIINRWVKNQPQRMRLLG